MKKIILAIFHTFILLQFTEASNSETKENEEHPLFKKNTSTLKTCFYLGFVNASTGDMVKDAYLSHDDGKSKIYPTFYGPISNLREKDNRKVKKFRFVEDDDDDGTVCVHDFDTDEKTPFKTFKKSSVLFANTGEDHSEVPYDYFLLDLANEECFDADNHIHFFNLYHKFNSYPKSNVKNSDKIKDEVFTYTGELLTIFGKQGKPVEKVRLTTPAMTPYNNSTGSKIPYAFFNFEDVTFKVYGGDGKPLPGVILCLARCLEYKDGNASFVKTGLTKEDLESKNY